MSTRDDSPNCPERGQRLTAVVCMVVLLALAAGYVGAYAYLRHAIRFEVSFSVPVGVPTSFVIAEYPALGPDYQSLAHTFFGPLERVDQLLRPSIWEPR